MVPSDSLTVDPDELFAALSGSTPPVVFDVRWRLSGPPGRDDYAAGHIPGSAFLDLDTELAGPPGVNGRHPLPDPAVLQRALRDNGARDDHPIVVYDAGDGQAAARAWWVLRWAGHEQTRVLDGGFARWVAAGHPVTQQIDHPKTGDFTVNPDQMPTLDAGEAGRLAQEGRLLDARVPARFRGEVEPVDPVAGHIPGAVNAPTTENAGPGGRLRSAADLRARFEALGIHDGVRVGAYCGSGVTAAHTVLALHRAGRTDAALYVGSWSDWVTDPTRPVAVGD